MTPPYLALSRAIGWRPMNFWSAQTVLCRVPGGANITTQHGKLHVVDCIGEREPQQHDRLQKLKTVPRQHLIIMEPPGSRRSRHCQTNRGFFRGVDGSSTLSEFSRLLFDTSIISGSRSPLASSCSGAGFRFLMKFSPRGTPCKEVGRS